MFNETWWILVEVPSQNTMWDSHTNLSLFKSNLTEPMGSDLLSVWMCVFSLLDLNIGQARFYFLTNVNSLKYVFNFKFLEHKNMFISYDHWYTPISQTNWSFEGKISPSLSMIWDFRCFMAQERKRAFDCYLHFLSALLTTCFHIAGLSATRSIKSAFLEESIKLTFIELNSDNNPFWTICFRA